MDAAPMIYHSLWHQSAYKDLYTCPEHGDRLTSFGEKWFYCNDRGHMVPFEEANPPAKEPDFLTALHA